MSTFKHTHSGPDGAYGHAQALAVTRQRDRIRDRILERLRKEHTDAIFTAQAAGHSTDVAADKGLDVVFDRLFGLAVDNPYLCADLAHWHYRLAADLDGTEEVTAR